jgi:hypothetical protein
VPTLVFHDASRLTTLFDIVGASALLFISISDPQVHFITDIEMASAECV